MVAIVCVGFAATVNMYSLPNSNAILSSYGYYDPQVNSPNPNDENKCTSAGNKCNMTVTLDAQVSSFAEIENTYLVEIEFKEISSIYNGDSTTTFRHDVKGFTLPKDYKLKIINCHDFPEVEGVILDLGGKTLNDTGALIVKIVKNV